MSEATVATFFAGFVAGMLAIMAVAFVSVAERNSKCIEAGYIGAATGTALKGDHCVKALKPEIVVVPFSSK